MNTQLTSKYRDIFKIERNKILINYAKQTSDYGPMYYIYSKNSQNENTYNATLCEEGREHEVIEINSEDLPQEAEQHSVLRLDDGNYILDEESTNEVSEQLEEIMKKLQEEKKQELQRTRIEGHIYQVSDKSEDTVYLFDITQDDANGLEEIEELEISPELLEQIEEGDKLIYENGNYQIYELL